MIGATLSRDPVKVVVYPRAQFTWEMFEQIATPSTIALDGIVLGGPRYDEARGLINFDHHDGVVREATMSTAMQVYLAIKGGLMDRFENCTVYVNDTDQDTSFAVWLLIKHKLFEGTNSVPSINRLLHLNNWWDITGGAFPIALDDKLVREHNWVFAPYTQLRISGGIATATPEGMRDNLESVLARLDRLLMGGQDELELDTRHEILDRISDPPCWFVDEVGGNAARYHLYSQGMPAFVSIVARRPDGRTVYSVGRRSRYIRFPVPQILERLSAIETSGGRWGGSDIIGGSSREFGSALSWERIRDEISILSEQGCSNAKED